jgi:ABC-type multidrug transport system fused ATPase/permease subunit
MGSFFTKLMSISTPPHPTTIRKFSLFILLSLAIPKVAWDIIRLKTYSTKDEESDDLTDPALRVLRLALSKALMDLNRCWDQVLKPYCHDEISEISSVVIYFQSAAKDIVDKLKSQDVEYERRQQQKTDANKKEKEEIERAEHDADKEEEEEEVTSATEDDAETPTKDADAEDGFLEQWSDTLNNTINKPMYEAFKIKEDDAKAEKEVRAMIRAVIFVGECFITALKTKRRKNALRKFVETKNKFDANPKNEKLRDEMNRDRAKLDVFVNRRNQEYAYFIDDKDLKVALHQYGQQYQTKTVTALDGIDIVMLPSEWHSECWNDWDKKERFLRYRIQWLPVEWWKDIILPKYIQFAVQARIVDINIEYELGSIKSQRFWKLLTFINNDMCGQWHQRGLIVFAWILGAVQTAVDTTEWHYRSSLLIQTIEQTLKKGRSTTATRAATLLDVCVSIVVMKSSSALLGDLLHKVKEAGQGSIRRGLVSKVTHHILSQDLEDAVDSGDSDKHHQLISSLSSSRNWDHSLGSVLLIPQSVISQFTMIISSASLMWSKSGTLLLAVGVAIVFKEYIEKIVKRFEYYLSRSIGLDKYQWQGWYEMHSIRTALSNFEDMRINAKEIGILKDAKKITQNAEADQVRMDLIPSIMRPLYLFLDDVPTVIGAYVGGTLAQGGSLSAADLAGFTIAISSLLDGCKDCYKTCRELVYLEDDRFKHGFQIMDLLEMKPTMGLENGWMPDKASEENNVVTEVQNVDSTILEELDDQNCLSGDIIFNNVSFKYKGMQSNMLKNVSFTIKSGSFVGICGERGAGKSTMYKLIMRLYDPAEGTITIGGHDLSYFNPVYLRSSIGLSVQCKFSRGTQC